MNSVLPVAETVKREYWDNDWLPPLDAIAVMAFIARQKPKTYFEVGSGYSTIAARHVINKLGLGTRIVSVDPKPRADIDKLCDEAIRSPFEKLTPDDYRIIEPGDVVFIDNSHYCFQGSDATAVFIDFIPSLPSGVIIGIHDVFLPLITRNSRGDVSITSNMLLLPTSSGSEIERASSFHYFSLQTTSPIHLI